MRTHLLSNFKRNSFFALIFSDKVDCYIIISKIKKFAVDNIVSKMDGFRDFDTQRTFRRSGVPSFF